MVLDAELIKKVLTLIERDLRARILPEMSTAGGKLQIDYMTRLLRWISGEVSARNAQISAYEADIAQLLAQAQGLALPSADAGFRGAPDEDATLELLRAIAAAGRGGATLFDRYVAVEAAFVEAGDAEGGSGFSNIYQGGRLDGGSEKPVLIDAPTLTSYLRRRFPTQLHALARDVSPLPGGFGKDTFLFQIEGAGALDGQAVIRKDFAVPPGPGKVTDEFPMLKTLYASGLPVAEPLWAEDDDSVLGGRFIVSRRAAGTNDIASWSQDEEARRHFVDRLAKILARIHAVTPADLGHAESLFARAAMQAHMRVYYHHYRSRRQNIHGRIEAAYAWLWANLPASDTQVARLVHGDIGFHNILTSNGEIEAVLDWEFSHFGDPAADIGYCWQFISNLTEWDAFMAMYRQHGGTPPSFAAASFYRVWGDVRNACMGVGATGTVRLSIHADIRSPTAGLAFTPLCEIQALRGAAAWNHAAEPQA